MDAPESRPRHRYVVVIASLMSARTRGSLAHVPSATSGTHTLLLCGESDSADVYEVLHTLHDLAVAVHSVSMVTEAA